MGRGCSPLTTIDVLLLNQKAAALFVEHGQLSTQDVKKYRPQMVVLDVNSPINIPIAPSFAMSATALNENGSTDGVSTTGRINQVTATAKAIFTLMFTAEAPKKGAVRKKADIRIIGQRKLWNRDTS